MKRVEIVVPCYNEAENISALYEEVNSVFSALPAYCWSLLFVDDGSKDKTVAEIQKLRERDRERVELVSFARNFGKEAAIYAGLANSTGDLVVLMDADLQHPPAMLPEMLKGIEEGYDCCGARRVSRKGEPLIRSAFSKLFYGFINKVTCMQLVPGGSDYRVMTRKMVNAVLQLTERERFIKGILSWVGFDTKWIPYENVERHAGKTKWSFSGLSRYALNGFVSFATTPLRAVVYMGTIIVIVSLAYALYTFINALNPDTVRSGFSTIIILILFLGGVIIATLGVIGEYMARIYLELKHRPIYIDRINTVTEKTSDPEEKV